MAGKYFGIDSLCKVSCTLMPVSTACKVLYISRKER